MGSDAKKYLGIQLDHNLKFNCQFNETYKLASDKLFMLRRLRSTITEYTALTIVKTMILPYLDMGNLFMSSQTAANQGKPDAILNTALRVVYLISTINSTMVFSHYPYVDQLP